MKIIERRWNHFQVARVVAEYGQWKLFRRAGFVDSCDRLRDIDDELIVTADVLANPFKRQKDLTFLARALEE